MCIQFCCLRQEQNLYVSTWTQDAEENELRLHHWMVILPAISKPLLELNDCPCEEAYKN